MSVRTIQLILEATDRNATREIREVRGGVQGLGTDLKSVTGLAARAAATLGVAFGAREVADFFLDTTRATQRLQAQLETFEGSRARGIGVFRDIERLAARTPFQIEEITEAYVRLRAIGLEPTSEQLISFGEVSAANSKELIQFVEAVNDAAVFEFERLKEFGIKVRTEGDRLRVSFRGQTRDIQKDGQAIVDLLTEIGQTEFAGGMSRQMQTIDGAFSNLMDNTATLIRTIGDAGLTGELQGVVERVRDLTAAAAENREEVQKNTRVALEALGFARDVFLFIPRLTPHLSQITAALITLAIDSVRVAIEEIQRGVNGLIVGLNALPLVDIGFRFEVSDQPLTDFRQLVDGLPGLLAESGAGAFGVLDDLVQSWVDVAVAAEVAGHAQVGAAGILDRNSGRIGTGATAGAGGRGFSAALDPTRARGAIFGGRISPAALGALTDRSLFGGVAEDPFAAVSATLFPGADGPALEAQVEGYRLAREASSAFRVAAIEDMEAVRQQSEFFAEGVRQDLLYGIVGAVELLGTAVAGGLGSFEDALGAVGLGVANILGDMMINAGTTIVLTSTAFEAFKAALLTLSPAAGIGVGLALIAAGAAMKAAVGGFLDSPTGGGGGAPRGGVSELGSTLRSGSERGSLTLVIEGGDFINLRDPHQRESFKRALRTLAGNREIVLAGA